MFVQFSELLAVEDRAYAIGELAERFGITLRTIRFYEQCGLLTAERASSRTRFFSSADVARLGFIVGCRNLGMTVKTVAALLAFRDTRGDTAFRRELRRALAAHVATLEAARDDIDAQKAATVDWIDQIEGDA